MFYTDNYRIVEWAGTFTVQRQQHFFLWRWWVTQGRYLGGTYGGEAWLDWSFKTIEQAKEYIDTRLLKDHSVALKPRITYYPQPHDRI